MATKKTKKAPAKKTVKKAAFPNLPISSADNIILNSTAGNWTIEMDKDANDILLIRIKQNGSTVVHEYKFSQYPKMRIRVTTGATPKLILETFTNFPGSVQYDVISKGNYVPFWDIVKNAYEFPSGGVECFKIIGTDDDRNFDNSKTTSKFVIANLVNSTYYIYIQYVAASGGNPLYYNIAALDSAIKQKGEATVYVNKANIKADIQDAKTKKLKAKK
ncbi:MAG: hypothetical protein POELPBGB_02437 [Bacteroidia bacterium]|nr:hypothetical protein [Bacteroidia bacterium]